MNLLAAAALAGKITVMREYQMTAVVDEDGELEIQLKTDLNPGLHRLKVVVDDALTAEQQEMLRVRMELGAFCEDWDDPEMSIYDDI